MVFEDTNPSTQSRKVFTSLVIVSLLIHFIFLHQFRWFKPEEKPKEQLIEVELLKTITPAPPKTHQALGSSRIESRSKKATAPSAKRVSPPQKAKETPRTAAVIKKAASVKPAAPKPIVQKPTISVKSSLNTDHQAPILKKDYSLTDKQLAIPILKTQSQPTTIPTSELPKPVSPLTAVPLSQQKADTNSKAKDVKVNNLIKKELDKEIQAPFLNRTPAEKSASTARGSGNNDGNNTQNRILGDPNGFRVSGEISSRKLIFVPPPPKLNLDQDVRIRLEFTVLPNGEVDQAFPVQKANPELERIAVEMLLQYRYEPLFGSNKVQKGSIEVILKR